ncbi:MAG: hypothetical protein MUE49_01770 [Rhodospirillales bacterium]|jgi:outer membrane lipoprotein SlyB|nr:hypothetical protein [Rhodospirillales bacterium]
MSRFVTPSLLAVATVALVACGTPSASRYQATDVGKSIQTARGVIVSSRPIEVAGETSPWGPAAGGALGGAGAYGAFGSGWTSVIGGVLGAGIGYAAQEALNSRSGYEYIVQMDDGRMVTVAQNRESSSEIPLPPGARVLVQTSGSYNRVIADPTAAAAPSAVAPPLN